MNATTAVSADLILLHAPSVYDFRERDDMIFAYLSDSDSVNVTGIYEMYPLGFHALKQHLQSNGLHVEIVNLASLMLMHPTLDVDQLLGKLQAPVFGLDIHWMPHCHGAIEVAKRIKAIHPDAVVIFGGISATYFADQLIQHPSVDVVVKGYDTLVLVKDLVEAIKRGERSYRQIPNLLWRKNGSIEKNDFNYKPAENYNDSVVDWSHYRAKSEILATRQIMTLPNTGCAYDCNWCGGSRFAYRNMMGVKKTLIQKDIDKITAELQTLGELAKTTSIYALQCYSETSARMSTYLSAVREMGIRSVFFEQFHLTDDKTLGEMGRSTKSFIMLSPESHDFEVSKLAGRGTYTMDEMEEWLPRAFDFGISGVIVWFFIGMRKQTPESVMETVDYSEALLKRFKGKSVLPLLCPMVPFLDPGSRFFEEPEEHGYRIFHRTLDQHRAAMVEPLWHRRLNYETIWMSRRQIQDISYDAVSRLVAIKGDLGVLPPHFCETVQSKIEDTKSLLAEAERALELDGRFPAGMRKTIRDYNRQILSYSSDQIIPMERPFGGRWFDDYTVPNEVIEACERPRA